MPILNGCYDAWCTGGSTNDMPGNLGVVTPKMCFQDAIDAIDAIDDVLSHKFHVCVFFSEIQQCIARIGQVIAVRPSIRDRSGLSRER